MILTMAALSNVNTLIECCSLNVDALFLLTVRNSQQLLCSSNTFYLLVWWMEQYIQIQWNIHIQNYQSRLLLDPMCNKILVFLMHTQWLYVKTTWQSPREMPKHLDRPLVACYSIGRNPPLRHVSRCDKNFKYTITNVFPTMVSVILDWISTN